MHHLKDYFKGLTSKKTLQKNVAQTAILITLFLFLSKIIGYFREVLIAKYFGASGETDTFLVALIIPSLIMDLISAGISTLIIPIYLEKKKENPEKAKIFVNQIFFIWCIILIFISLIIFLFAPFFVKLVAFGFEGERFDLATTLTRYLIPMAFATVLVGLFTGLFQARRQFLYPVLFGLIGNLLLVLCLIFLTPILGINSWTTGQILSAVFSFLGLFFILWRKNKFFQKFELKNIPWQEIKHFFSLLWPLIFVSAINILSQIIDKTIASSLEVGSIAILNFSQKIFNIPLSLLAMPLALAIFPAFSDLALEKNKKGDYAHMLQKALSLCFYIIIPSSIVFIALSQPITKFLFQRGAFTIEDTAKTALVSSMYCLGLFAYAANYFLVRAFYSFKDTKMPLIITIITVGLNIVGNLILSRFLGAAGIALATSISSSIGFALLLFYLHKKYFKFAPRRPLAYQVLKIILASLPLIAVSLLFKSYLSAPLSFLNLIFRFILVGIVIVLVYALMSRLFNLEGYKIIINHFKKSVSRFLN